LLYRLAALALLIYLSYFLTSHLGNPLAGLGLDASLNATERSFFSFLSSLAAGGEESLTYKEPSLWLALSATASTLAVLVPSFALSALSAAAWAYLVGFSCPRPVRALAFVPDYLYAALLYVASWHLPWPSPLPGTGPSKAAEYALVVFISQFPKALQVMADELSSRDELREAELLWRAVGLPERSVRAKVMRTLAPQLVSGIATLLVLSFERSVVVEPLIGYVGIGYLASTSVVEADARLAAASFVVVSAVSVAILSLASLVERALSQGLDV